MIERSLVLMKPDAVKRGIVGEILHRFERVGLKVVGAKLIQASDDMAEKHYPTTKEWYEKVGNNTILDCQKYGIDLVKSMGTTDPIEIGKLVKKWNKDFLTSGPVLAIVLEGMHAVERIRSLVGPTVPALAPAGTIRGDFSLESAISANRRSRAIYNLIHASGTVDEAKEEIDLWFRPEELLTYKRTHEDLYNY
jgi:nucleoside-diphosphate kinase